ncbi:hypothetical protein [Salinigranum sp. GCM10025319]|uniref:hypothetical protein n=1 Tax=Salinigranum sp. GCM10025319 TaxID=3252687 RepID=UPI00360B1089
MTDRPAEALADRRAASLDREGSLVARPIGLPTVAAVLAAAPVVAVALLRVARNAPGTLPSAVGNAYGVVVAAAWLGPAVAALVLAATAVERAERVGLAFVGAFGLVGGVTPVASLPAASAVVGGGALAVAARLRACRASPRARWVTAASAVIVAALACSLAGSLGIAPATLRPIGSRLALVGLATTPAFVRPRWPAVGLGVLTALAVLAIGGGLPFVTGAVLLVGGAVVDTSLVFVAGAAAGSVATLVAAARRRDVTRALGVATLAAGGVPATIPRALAAVVGLSLLVGVGRAHIATDGRSDGTGGERR